MYQVLSGSARGGWAAKFGSHEPSGGLPVGTNGRGASRAITSRRGVRWTSGFVSLARPALEQELLLSTLQKRLEALLLPKSETLQNLGGRTQALGTGESRSFERPSSN